MIRDGVILWLSRKRSKELHQSKGVGVMEAGETEIASLLVITSVLEK